MSDAITIVLSLRPSETGTWLAFNCAPDELPTAVKIHDSAWYYTESTTGDPEDGPLIGRGADPCKAVYDLLSRRATAYYGGTTPDPTVPKECPTCLRPL